MDLTRPQDTSSYKEFFMRCRESGIRQKQIAEAWGIPQSSVSYWCVKLGVRFSRERKPKTKMEKTCQNCGSVFIAKKSWQKYCCHACFGEYRTKNAKYSRIVTIPLRCDGCGYRFERTLNFHRACRKHQGSKRNFCCRECYADNQHKTAPKRKKYKRRKKRTKRALKKPPHSIN